MTFDQWWEENRNTLPDSGECYFLQNINTMRAVAKAAWDAIATNPEIIGCNCL